MYQQHFGLERRVFHEGIARDADVFLGASAEQLQADLTTALSTRDSVVVVTGRAGVGKTTVASHVLRNSTTRLALAWMGNTPLTAHELLEQLLTELGFGAYKHSRSERLQIWRQHLKEMSITDTKVCVMVDGADTFSADVLAALASLTAADPCGCHGANVILTSQSPLRDVLATPPLGSLKQRVRLSFALEALSESEMRRYLDARIGAAGGEIDEIFPGDALEALYAHTGGIFRVVNNLCETLLTVAAAEARASIDADLVGRVAVETFGLDPIGAEADADADADSATPAPATAPALARTETGADAATTPSLAATQRHDVPAPAHDGPLATPAPAVSSAPPSSSASASTSKSAPVPAAAGPRSTRVSAPSAAPAASTAPAMPAGAPPAAAARADAEPRTRQLTGFDDTEVLFEESVEPAQARPEPAHAHAGDESGDEDTVTHGIGRAASTGTDVTPVIQRAPKIDIDDPTLAARPPSRPAPAEQTAKPAAGAARPASASAAQPARPQPARPQPAPASPAASNRAGAPSVAVGTGDETILARPEPRPPAPRALGANDETILARRAPASKPAGDDDLPVLTDSVKVLVVPDVVVDSSEDDDDHGDTVLARRPSKLSSAPELASGDATEIIDAQAWEDTLEALANAQQVEDFSNTLAEELFADIELEALGDTRSAPRRTVTPEEAARKLGAGDGPRPGRATRTK